MQKRKSAPIRIRDLPGWPVVFRAQSCFFLGMTCERAAFLTCAWWMLSWSHGAHWLAIVTGFGVACEMGIKPLTGWLGDVVSKPLLIIVTTSISLAATAWLLLLVSLHIQAPLLVASGIGLISAATGAETPIRSSLMPELVALAHVDTVVRFSATVTSMAMVTGPALFGGFLSLVGVTGAFVLQAVFQLGELGLAFGLRRAAARIEAAADNEISAPRIQPGMVLRSLTAFPGIRTEFFLAMLSASVNLFTFPFFLVLLPQLVRHNLGLPAWYLGGLDTAFGIGIAFGSRYIMTWAAGYIGRAAVASFGFRLLALTLLACAFIDMPTVLVVAFFVGGVGLVSFNANTATLQLRATPRALRNRVSAVRAFFSGVGCPLGCALTYGLQQLMSVEMICGFFGVAVFGLGGGVLLVPHFKALLAKPSSEVEDAYALLYPEALARF